MNGSRVFADRFHAHVLKTPREVRHALAYVLLNANKHGVSSRRANAVDAYSSALLHQGWTTRVFIETPPPNEATTQPTTWLLNTGWKKHGPICQAKSRAKKKPVLKKSEIRKIN